MKYDKLSISTLNEEMRARTCGYWYVIQQNGSPHTAFQNRQALLNWMARLGLSVAEELPPEGTWSHQNIIGEYCHEMHSSYDVFFALKGKRIKHLDNGDYTLGIITSEYGTCDTIHTLNPNCHDRPVYPYHECRAVWG